jgi:hypothetical protein
MSCITNGTSIEIVVIMVVVMMIVMMMFIKRIIVIMSGKAAILKVIQKGTINVIVGSSYMDRLGSAQFR